MPHLQHRIFQLLLARSEAVAAYNRVSSIYVTESSQRSVECFDTLTADIELDKLLCCSDFTEFKTVEMCDALDHLEYDKKIIVDDTVTPTIIKLA